MVEVIIISFYCIKSWRRPKHTKVWLLMKGIMIIMAFILLAVFFEMHTIVWIVQNVLSLAVIAVIVVLQPELRHALEELGRKVLLQISLRLKSRRMNAFQTRPSMIWSRRALRWARSRQER